jgi:probable F420-dependent oxidoreductase
MARKVEDLGYSTLFAPDHLAEDGLAPMVALAFAAEATSTLRLGTLVLANDFRHPVVLARECATLDLLSEGRLEVGLGAGWMTTDFTRSGLPFDDARTRVERLAEAVTVVKGCFAGGPFDVDGAHYRVSGLEATPAVVQQPRPPILIGGGAAQVLRLAGREADIVGLSPNLAAGAMGADVTLDTLDHHVPRKLAWIREGAGERFDELELQIRYFLATVTDDARSLTEQLAPLFGVTPDEMRRSSAVCVGTVDEICDTLERRRAEWGTSYVVVDEHSFEAFAPVVARLAGT